MSETDTDWEELADTLHEHGNVPAKRARVVALVATGRTHAQAADILDTSTGNVYNHLDKYHERNLEPAQWLASNGPVVIESREGGDE